MPARLEQSLHLAAQSILEGSRFMAHIHFASPIGRGLPTTGWRGLLLAVTVVHLLNGIAVTLAAGSLFPTYVLFPILWIIGIVRLRRGGSSGIVWLGATSLAFVLLHLPFTVPELSNPTQLFVPTVIYNLASVITIVAAVMARRASRTGLQRATIAT